MSGSPEFRDGLANGPVRGRGAGLNPGNRFEDIRLHVLGDHLEDIVAERPDGSQVLTHIHDDRTRTVVNRVDSPDLGMYWTLNPYRGCEHGCIYCYARPTHEYLGFSCGLDFETRITAKREAPALLRAVLSSPKWDWQMISMSGVTDPYQPIEAKLGITRGCLQVMAEMGQPVGVITKSRLITRDLDILGAMAKEGLASAAVSITTLDHDLAAKMEPRAASPKARLEAVSRLRDAGVPVAVMMAPIVPGLTDHEIPALLKAVADAGASSAGYVMLKLPYQVKDLFLEWLRRHFPDRASHVESQVREARGGRLNDPRFFKRQRGEGPRADQIRQAFSVFKDRYGLNRSPAEIMPHRRAPRPPGPAAQLPLFG